MIRIQLKTYSIRPGPGGYRPIKFYQNLSITCGDIPLKCNNPV